MTLRPRSDLSLLQDAEDSLKVACAVWEEFHAEYDAILALRVTLYEQLRIAKETRNNLLPLFRTCHFCGWHGIALFAKKRRIGRSIILLPNHTTLETLIYSHLLRVWGCGRCLLQHDSECESAIAAPYPTRVRRLADNQTRLEKQCALSTR